MYLPDTGNIATTSTYNSRFRVSKEVCEKEAASIQKTVDKSTTAICAKVIQ